MLTKTMKMTNNPANIYPQLKLTHFLQVSKCYQMKINKDANVRWVNVLEDDVLYVGENNSDALEEETQYVPLHLWLLVTLRFIPSVHGKAQMDLNGSQNQHHQFHHHLRIISIAATRHMMLSPPSIHLSIHPSIAPWARHP